MKRTSFIGEEDDFRTIGIKSQWHEYNITQGHNIIKFLDGEVYRKNESSLSSPVSIVYHDEK